MGVRHFVPALFALVLALLLGARLTTFRLATLTTDSMAPGIRSGSTVLLRVGSSVDRGSVLVCPSPRDPDRRWIGRVMAVPGDRIEAREGHIVLNGVELAAQAVASASARGEERIVRESLLGGRHWQTLVNRGRPLAFGEHLVATGYFLLTDNRSSDPSHVVLGEFAPDQCIGRVFLILLAGPGVPPGIPQWIE